MRSARDANAGQAFERFATQSPPGPSGRWTTPGELHLLLGGRGKIRFGDQIISKIEDGLRNSRYVVTWLGEGYTRSGWCRAEYGPILYREFSGVTSRRVIPLTLDGALKPNSVPLLRSEKMRADFTDATSFDAFLDFLKEGFSPGLAWPFSGIGFCCIGCSDHQAGLSVVSHRLNLAAPHVRARLSHRRGRAGRSA